MVSNEIGSLILKSFNRCTDHNTVKIVRMNSIAYIALDMNKTWEKSIDFTSFIVFSLAWHLKYVCRSRSSDGRGMGIASNPCRILLKSSFKHAHRSHDERWRSKYNNSSRFRFFPDESMINCSISLHRISFSLYMIDIYPSCDFNKFSSADSIRFNNLYPLCALRVTTPIRSIINEITLKPFYSPMQQ